MMSPILSYNIKTDSFTISDDNRVTKTETTFNCVKNELKSVSDKNLEARVDYLEYKLNQIQEKMDKLHALFLLANPILPENGSQ